MLKETEGLLMAALFTALVNVRPVCSSVLRPIVLIATVTSIETQERT